jgi:hypothetical protein
VAAELRKENKLNVELETGGIGELSVHFDDQKVVDTNRFWYPSPRKIVDRVQALLIDPLPKT